MIAETLRRQGVLASGGLLVLGCFYQTSLSNSFAYGSQVETRPVVLLVALMVAMFVVNFAGLYAGLKSRFTNRSLQLVIVVAVLCRLALLPSEPIQEVDLYRYLWDGQVSAQGVSPFAYAPQQVLDCADERVARADSQPGGRVAPRHLQIDQPSPDLVRLADHVNADPVIRTLLQRVHYAELTTVYPPVSQWVFWIVARVMPETADAWTHVLGIKLAIIIFDLATIPLILVLLRAAGRSSAWVIAYAWNPLVLKEFAGSGHLDSIAVFFFVAAICLAVKQRWTRSAAMLAIATAAKLFPILVLPALIVACWRSRGAAAVSGAAVTFCCVLGVCFTPEFVAWQQRSARVVIGPARPSSRQIDGAADNVGRQSFASLDAADLPPELILPEVGESPEAIGGASMVPESGRPGQGFREFFTRWEMNDIAFLLIHENLRQGSIAPDWLTLPRSAARDRIDLLLGPSPQASFLAARGITLVIWCLVAAAVSSGIKRNDSGSLLGACFLLIAAFWFLAPTLNPWYWTWALPLVAFARHRAWLAVACCLSLYYLRFWCMYHPENRWADLTGLSGTDLFDFGIVFVEHGIWMTLLAGEIMICWWVGKPPADSTQPDSGGT